MGGEQPQDNDPPNTPKHPASQHKGVVAVLLHTLFQPREFYWEGWAKLGMVAVVFGHTFLQILIPLQIFENKWVGGKF